MTAKNRKRNVPLMIWVTPQERSLIEEKMAQLGIGNMSAYLRKIAIDGYVVKLELTELSNLAATMRRSSNSLNQIARRVNETGRIYADDLEDIRLKQEESWAGLAELLTRLGTLL